MKRIYAIVILFSMSMLHAMEQKSLADLHSDKAGDIKSLQEVFGRLNAGGKQLGFRVLEELEGLDGIHGQAMAQLKQPTSYALVVLGDKTYKAKGALGEAEEDSDIVYSVLSALATLVQVRRIAGEPPYHVVDVSELATALDDARRPPSFMERMAERFEAAGEAATVGVDALRADGAAVVAEAREAVGEPVAAVLDKAVHDAAANAEEAATGAKHFVERHPVVAGVAGGTAAAAAAAAAVVAIRKARGSDGCELV